MKKKMTIEGARLRFKGEKSEKPAFSETILEEAKRELRQILEILG